MAYLVCLTTLKTSLRHLLTGAAPTGLLLISLYHATPAWAQIRPQTVAHRQQVEVSFVALKFVANSQALGVHAQYSFAPSPWLVLAAGVSTSPTGQPLNLSSEILGTGIDYNYGAIHIGRAFRKVALYGTVAGGDTVQRVYVGQRASGDVRVIRNTPTVSLGVKLEVPVSNRLSLNYSVQNNSLLYGDITLYNGSTSFLEHGTTANAQEFRFGVGFTFSEHG